MNGILVVNKQIGISSGGVVAGCRRLLNIKKIGHMGTLDPAASGVLVLGIGKGTKLFDFFLAKTKKYRAEFEFGYETDTLDYCGRVTKSGGGVPSCEQISAALERFRGEIEQLPPQYSAKSVGGVRAYKLARSGETAQLKPCRVSVFDYKLVCQLSETRFCFEMTVGGGVYIRSLARDLGVALGTFATMTSLTRTQCGAFSLSDAVLLDDVCKERVLDLSCALAALRRVDFDESVIVPLTNGGAVRLLDATEGELCCAFCGGVLIGLGRARQGVFRIETDLYERA